MRFFLRAIAAEALKQHRNYFHSQLIYFSMLVWPALSFAAAYYMYQPFVSSPELAQRVVPGGNSRSIALFILSGYLAYTFFWCLVQSAWRFSWERFSGTLEMIFLTPASRFGFILGNAAASLFESAWLFFVFSVGGFALFGEGRLAHPALLALGLFALVVPALAWGALLNSIFIFSRDSGFLYTILEEPMSFFSGVRIPTGAFPLWARFVGAIFPLTYALRVLRNIVLEGASLSTIGPDLGILLGVSAAMLVLAWKLVELGERHAKRTGNLSLF